MLMSDSEPLRQHYKRSSADNLARIALRSDLTPEAAAIIKQELQGRGLTHLSDFTRQMEEDALVRNPARYNEVTWEMERRWNRSIFVAAIVSVAWLFAAAFPLLMQSVNSAESTSSKIELISIIYGTIGLSVYLGFRSRKQGSRSPSEDSRDQSARPRTVVNVSRAESRPQRRLFDADAIDVADDDGKQYRKKRQPVTHREGEAEHREQRARVRGVSDIAVRTPVDEPMVGRDGDVDGEKAS
jgi:hypothetical protein